MNLLKTRNNIITYTVNKNEYNNMYISVQNGEVIINAPWYTTSNQIQQAVEEKRQWIINKLNEYEEACERKKEYIKLQTVKVLGKNYDLVIKYKMIKTPNLSIEDSQIRVILPSKYKKLGNNQILNMLIEKMYDMIAKKEIEEAMEKYRIMTGYAPEDYCIERNDKFLAKCVERKITINPKVAMYSKKTIEYIVLHECCHLKYKNHTKSFYNMLETYMPNYEKYALEIVSKQY